MDHALDDHLTYTVCSYHWMYVGRCDRYMAVVVVDMDMVEHFPQKLEEQVMSYLRTLDMR